jgi:hypothetical protein
MSVFFADAQLVDVELDVGDLERDVLVGLETHGLDDLVVADGRHADVAEDHVLAADRRRDALGAELRRAHQVGDRVATRCLVGHVDLGMARDDHVVLVPRQFDGLDATVADVETDDALAIVQHDQDVAPADGPRRCRRIGRPARPD